MTDIAIVYRSKSGYTRKYAQWLAEELGADLFEAKDVAANQIKKYHTVIYGAGLYARGISHINWARMNIFSIPHQRHFLFTTGLSPFRPGLLKELENHNLRAEERNRISLFYMRGGFDFSRLTTYDRILMTLLKAKIRRKSDLSPDERGMLAAYDKPVDFTRQDRIAELVAAVKNGLSEGD